MNDLRVNTSLFKTGGVLGRKDFLINSFKILALSILVCVPTAVGKSLGDSGLAIGGLASFVGFLPIIFFGAHNNFKRFRDIRGKTNDETAAFIGLMVGLFIPIVSIFVNLYLVFCKGAVTGSSSGPRKSISEESKKVA